MLHRVKDFSVSLESAKIMINRRHFLEYCGGGLASLTLSGCRSVWPHGQSRRPNILLITADDMHYDSLGCFGSKVPDITPHIDQLAREGMRFTQAHVDTAVCTPCRATVLTGRYPHRNGALGFYPINPGVPTLNEVLHQAGYLTGICGKGTINSRGLFYKGPWDFALGGGIDFNYGRHVELFYTNTKSFLDRAKNESKPFFFWINSTDPHRPFDNSKKHNYLPHLNRHSSIPSRLVTPDEVDVPGFLPDLPEVREELARYFSSVKRCDDAVGETLRALAESGLAADTMVMFFSDHGMAFPFAKSCCYPFSTKTPLIVKWPSQVRPNRVDKDHFINSVDFMPTLLDIAAAPAPDGMDGQSFLPLLLGRKQRARDSVFTQFDQAGDYPLIDGTKAYIMPIRTVQNKKWCYLFNPWSDGSKHHGGDIFFGLSYPAMRERARTDPQMAKRINVALYRSLEEFYDLEQDPNCLNNLIDNPEYRVALDTMRHELRQFMVDSDDYVLEAFDHRYDKDFLKNFNAQVHQQGKEAQEKTLRFGYALEYYKSIEKETATGQVKVSLHKPEDFRLEVWTWLSKKVLAKNYTDTQDLVVDISGNPKGTYMITLHFANQVVTRSISFK